VRAYRQIPRPIRLVLRWLVIIAAAIVGDFALLFFLSALTSAHLIDWTTVISFLAVELLAAVIAKLLGIGEESEGQRSYRTLRMAALKDQLLLRYAHLHVVCLKDEDEEAPPEYPESNYYVVNVLTGIGYWAFIYIYDLVEQGVITFTEFKSSSELQEWLKESKVRIESKYPLFNELGLPYEASGLRPRRRKNSSRRKPPPS
jgi:hypothetical protein